MAKIEIRQICDYLDKVEWQYYLLEPENLIKTGWSCRVPYYKCSMPVEVRLTKHWVVIQGVLLKKVPVQHQLPVHVLLSTLNGGCRQARYYISDDRILLQTEIPAIRCTRDLFLEALSNICRNFNVAGPEITTVATNSSVANLLLKTNRKNVLDAASDELEDEDNASGFNFVVNQLNNT